MLEFLNLKPETFGLDISDLSLKLVRLKKRGNSVKLVSFGEEKIDRGIIKEGEIIDNKALANIIRKALSNVKGEKIRTKYVIASLPEEKSFLQIIQMPKMPLEDLKSAVIYEAENYIPLPIEQVYFDSQIVKPVVDSLDHFDVLIAALPRKTVDSYINCIKEAGLIPYVLEIESLAIARALIKKEISPFPVLLIDFGATRTSFIFFSGYSLRFTTSISFSANNLTETIADNLKINFKEAEALKKQYGLEPIPKVFLKGKSGESKFEKGIIGEKRIFEILSPLLNNLTDQIKNYLDYYKTHSPHEHLASLNKEVEKIIILGGGANLKGIESFLSSTLKIPVELGNPWVNIYLGSQKEKLKIDYSDSLRYVTALGLALRGIKEDYDKPFTQTI